MSFADDLRLTAEYRHAVERALAFVMIERDVVNAATVRRQR
jgi:hypothetical protein